jgi:hypothetical protein
MTTTLSLVLLLLRAAPSPLPSPRVEALEGCSAAACTGDARVRICKCVPAAEDQRPGLVVDREGGRHVEWDATAWRGQLDDFLVLQVDLDGDGEPELVVANPSQEGSLRREVTYEVAVVDGARDTLVWGLAQDFGPDAVRADSLLFTEWEHGAGQPVFVGREYGYRQGRLEARRAPVLRRTLDPAFEREREASADGGVAWPRRRLSAPGTRAGQDEPGGKVSAVVRGVSTDEGELELHLETSAGAWLTLSSGRDARPPLRLGDARARRLFPAGYVPPDPADWLLGRVVRGDFEALQSGLVWVSTAPPSQEAGGP